MNAAKSMWWVTKEWYIGASPNPLVSARSIKTLRSFRARVGYGDIPCRAHHIAHDLPKQKITGGLYLIGTRLTEQSHLESAIHIQAKLVESNRPRCGRNINPIPAQPEAIRTDNLEGVIAGHRNLSARRQTVGFGERHLATTRDHAP